MNSAIVTFKTDQITKYQVKKVADDLGMSLSSILNGYLRELIRNRTVHFEARSYEPSDYLVEAIKEAEEDRKNGWVSPSFDNAEDSLKWLDDPNRKYVRDLQ